jgi:hypothetical protein
MMQNRAYPYRFEQVNLKEVTSEVRREFSTTIKQRRIMWFEPEYLPEIIADKMALFR